MEKLNAIVIDGKVYETVDAGEEELPCDLCCFNKKCWQEEQWHICKSIFGSDSYFRYSPTLTDKLNRE